VRRSVEHCRALKGYLTLKNFLSPKMNGSILNGLTNLFSWDCSCVYCGLEHFQWYFVRFHRVFDLTNRGVG